MACKPALQKGPCPAQGPQPALQKGPNLLCTRRLKKQVQQITLQIAISVQRLASWAQHAWHIPAHGNQIIARLLQWGGQARLAAIH